MHHPLSLLFQRVRVLLVDVGVDCLGYTEPRDGIARC